MSLVRKLDEGYEKIERKIGKKRGGGKRRWEGRDGGGGKESLRFWGERET